MTSDLSALIARLEATEVGSRDIDGEIALAFGYPRDVWGEAFDRPFTVDGPAHHDDAATWSGGGKIWSAPAFTTSLDAALALAERVLPGCSPGMSQNVHSRDWFAWLGYTEDGEAKLHAQTFGKTPALALCIAVLKAKQEPKP